MAQEIGEKEANEKGGNYVQFYKLGQGVEFRGKLVDKKPGKYGEDYYFQVASGPNRVNPNPDLRKRLAVAKIGDDIGITWTGDKDVEKPSPMKVFKVMKYN